MNVGLGEGLKGDQHQHMNSEVNPGKGEREGGRGEGRRGGRKGEIFHTTSAGLGEQRQDEKS